MLTLLTPWLARFEQRFKTGVFLCDESSSDELSIKADDQAVLLMQFLCTCAAKFSAVKTTFLVPAAPLHFAKVFKNLQFRAVIALACLNVLVRSRDGV